MTLTTKYQAAPVDAVQVTWENCEEVAAWAGGKVRMKAVDEITADKKVHIQLPAVGLSRPFPAHLNDWVIREDSGKFRVFKEKVFAKIFHEVTRINVVTGEEVKDDTPSRLTVPADGATDEVIASEQPV